MYLVSGLEGQVSSRVADGDQSPLTKGRFLPSGASITTDSGEGLELIGGGWIIRLGQGASFTALEGGLFLDQGAFLAKPMRESSELILKTSKGELSFLGTGAFIGEVIESGSFRIIGLTGETNMRSFSNRRRRRADLKPGQRVELSLSGRFGKTVDLDLAKLVKTSRLISLMPHASSFKGQLYRAVEKQRTILAMGSRGAQVDVVSGLSYAPVKGSPLDGKETSAPVNSSIASTERPASPSNPIAADKERKPIEEHLRYDFSLPFIPGPRPRFPARSMPEPTLKEIFSEPLPETTTPFPGRIFNR